MSPNLSLFVHSSSMTLFSRMNRGFVFGWLVVEISCIVNCSFSGEERARGGCIVDYAPDRYGTRKAEISVVAILFNVPVANFKKLIPCEV